MIDKYASTWQLSDIQQLTETNTSQIYKVRYQDELAVLKILKPLGLEDEKYGALALKYFNGQSAVKILQYDEQAQLLEYAEGPDLKQMALNGEDDKATRIMAELLGTLYSQTGSKPEVPDLNRRFRSLFDKVIEEKNSKSIYSKAGSVAKELLSKPEASVVLHGDVHHENIRHSKRGYLAIDPKGLIGEPCFDAANILCNPTSALVLSKGRLGRQAKILCEILNLDYQRLLSYTFAYSALSAAWFIEDNEDPQSALLVADLVAPMLLKS